ncbi:type IV toxin-antitoxin system AbiEi family antitoxin domain-containing protein [Paraconexibacter algicola]|uniref:AbiEi antitoxin N-terminal domain-containing protein n=1 Tax=Paraconexibacter algicola TaxID=2133960 RepID=A0A2T4UKJ9_9ACTN|nr:type IV toxin-antitoxin system AbiEi family antitoxin domain-containing protein [Paraconexibacter algicola]PTL59769.1 hypothetical protein C7Y72_08945 [Paraconexibacter algicola]
MVDWQQITRHARRQDGAVSLGQLRLAGMTDDQVLRACATGRLHRRHRGVFVVGSDVPTRHGRLWAASLAAGPGAWLYGLTALELLGLRPPAGDAIHLGAPTRRRTRGALVLHEASRVEARHLWRRRGMAVAFPPLALLGAAPSLDDDALAVLVANAVARRTTSPSRMLAAAEHFLRHPGVPALRRVVAAELADPGHGRTHAEMEARFLALLRALPGLPPYRRNEPLHLAEDHVVVPDVWFPGPRVWLELDSRTWHEQRRAMDRDRRKDQRAAALGVVVFRITWQQLLHEWERVARDLLAVLAR